MTPAKELNQFIERLADYLKKTQPSFVKSYNVSVSTKTTVEDTSNLRFVLNFEISNAEIRSLSESEMIKDRGQSET